MTGTPVAAPTFQQHSPGLQRPKSPVLQEVLVLERTPAHPESVLALVGMMAEPPLPGRTARRELRETRTSRSKMAGQPYPDKPISQDSLTLRAHRRSPEMLVGPLPPALLHQEPAARSPSHRVPVQEPQFRLQRWVAPQTATQVELEGSVQSRYRQHLASPAHVETRTAR